MKKNSKSIFVVWITAFLLVLGNSATAQAQNTALGNEDLEKLRQEVPALSKNVKIVTERGRQLLEFSLKDVLHLMLYRNTTIQTSKFGEDAADAQLIIASQIDKPILTATIQQTNSASASSTDLADASGSPYLTSLNRSSTAIISTLSKKIPWG